MSARTFEEFFKAVYVRVGFVSSKDELREAWDASRAALLADRPYVAKVVAKLTRLAVDLAGCEYPNKEVYEAIGLIESLAAQLAEKDRAFEAAPPPPPPPPKSIPPFFDQSAASPEEKARRVLAHLSRLDSVYFYEDGYPRSSVLRGDAAAALAVLDELIASRKSFSAQLAEKEANAKLCGKLVSILSKHCGECGDNEGAVETLTRIIRERASHAGS